MMEIARIDGVVRRALHDDATGNTRVYYYGSVRSDMVRGSDIRARSRGVSTHLPG